MTPNDPTTPKIEIGRLIKDTYGFLWRHIADLSLRTLIPVLALGAIFWAASLLKSNQTVDVVVFIVVGLAGAGLIMHFVVAWHRLILFGREAVGGPFAIRFGMRELKFIGLGVLLNVADKLIESLAGFILENVPIALAILIIVIFLAGFFYLFLRWSLALPLIATDRGSALATAWRMADGHCGRMFLAAVGIFTPPIVISIGGLMILAPLHAPVLFFGFFALYYVAIIVLFATFLSTAYLQLTAKPST